MRCGEGDRTSFGPIEIERSSSKETLGRSPSAAARQIATNSAITASQAVAITVKSSIGKVSVDVWFGGRTPASFSSAALRMSMSATGATQ
jgi:hypothetical protein